MTGDLTFFLVLQIKQSRTGVAIWQAKYSTELIRKSEAIPSTTPMSTNVKLDKDEKCISAYQKHYLGMIGSLLYLTDSTPNILFIVYLCACFQSDPKESHLVVVKRILKYLSGTAKLTLWYPRDAWLVQMGYSDSDFTWSRVDRSTSSTCQFLGNSLVSWHRKEQSFITLSTVEYEYNLARSYKAQIL